MDKSLYVAMSGASASLRAQATVAHNLANANTVGFKAAHVATEAFRIPGEGLPSRVAAVPAQAGFDARAGAVMTTGGALDVALHENVWLAVQDRAGGVAYTRAGELRLSPNGMLTTVHGHPVLGENGPITVPPHERLTIGNDGTLSIQPQGQGADTLAVIGRMQLVRAEAPNALARGEDGLMRAAGEPLPPAAGSALTPGALEGSNVDTAGMLVQMIQLSRQFEMQVKLLKAGEDNARASTSLMRMG
ncbi:MAG: flagellar basal body rod protein FlgF [Rehaibacterium terrae]|uniref:flagellar basal body rod protein FlgF n=1 Tax=Rehaibacterium terrae TaxID=1341696 RepID=UPI00391B49B8